MKSMMVIGVCLLLAWIVIPSAYGTSIVAAMVEKQRIILAADTRYNKLDKSSNILRTLAFHDDICKIAALGKVGFAVAGFSLYRSVELSDLMTDWSAVEDAKTAYSLHSNDLREIADDWLQRAMRHYEIMYSIYPNLVRNLASSNIKHELLVGVFVGWDSKGEPTLIIERLTLNEIALSGIIGMPVVRTLKDKLFTTHPITLELVEGKSERAKVIVNKWKSILNNVPESDRVWRWVEFLIQATSDYDESVGKEVNILEILPSGEAHWLQNSTCPAGAP